MSLLFKWIFVGASVAAMNEFRRAREAPHRIRQQATGVARKGVVALAGLMVASIILSAGVIIAINNWFVTFENTGSFSTPASVWGGVTLATLGGIALFLTWPPNQSKQKQEEPQKSELQETITLALKSYIDEKQRQREIRKNKTFIRSIS